jgi:hypothetical protein
MTGGGRAFLALTLSDWVWKAFRLSKRPASHTTR